MRAMLILAGAIAALAAITGFEPLAAQEPEAPQDDHWAVPTGEIVEPDPPEVVIAKIEGEPRKTPLNLRLADNLLPEERERLVALIAENPAWTIGEPATHEIAPDPRFSEQLVVTRIKRFSPRPGAAYSRFMSRREAMTLDEIAEYYDTDDKEDDAWKSNVPLPVRLGTSSDEEFAAALSDYLHRKARTSALLDQAGTHWFADSVICLGAKPSPTGHCALERADAIRLDFALHYSARIQTHSDLVFVNVIAIEPDGEVRLMLSKVADRVTESVDGVEIASFHLVDNHDSPFSFGKIGKYQLLTIVSDRAIDPAVWQIRARDTVLPQDCEDPKTRHLCLAMSGRVIEAQYDQLWGVEARSFYVYQRARPRVIGGISARPELARWQAQLSLAYSHDPFASNSGEERMNFEKAHKCGGSYIGDSFVLTAAHCIRDNLSEMRVRLGTADITRGGSLFSVHSVAVHARGSATRNRGDIALIRLHDPRGQLARLERNGKLKRIALAKLSEAQPPVGSLLTATGWGYQAAARQGASGAIDATGSPQRNPKLLQELDLLVARDDECLSLRSLRRYAAADIVCARGKRSGTDTCSGDSGGPLMTVAGGRWVQVGIVSAGEGCAQGSKPAVYTSTGAFADWIRRMKSELARIPASQRPIRRTDS